MKMKFSTLEKPKPTWKVPVAFSFTSTCTTTLVSSLPGLVGDLDRLEEAERGDALLAAAHAAAGEQLALVDAQLAADDLVAGLGVADDVDALDVDLLALLDVEGEVDGLRFRRRPR